MKQFFSLIWLALVMISGTALAQSYNIHDGSIVFASDGNDLTVTQDGATDTYQFDNTFPNILINGNGTTTPNTISINAAWAFGSGYEAIITLSNVVINTTAEASPISIESSSIVNLFLAPGTSNVLKTTALATESYSFPAIQISKINADPLLKIKGSGILVAEGSELAAGIGCDWAGPAGEVRIEDNVTVIARGGMGGAGIGGAEAAAGGTLSVSSNAIVIAYGGNRGDCSAGYPVGGAAGIGGGGSVEWQTPNGAGGMVTISGNARVTAYGGSSAAGIGGGESAVASGTISVGVSNKVIAVSDGDRSAIDDTSLDGTGYVMLLNFAFEKTAGTTNTLCSKSWTVLTNTVVPVAYKSLAFSVAETNTYRIRCNNIPQEHQTNLDFPVTTTGLSPFSQVADTNTLDYTLSTPVAIPYEWLAQHYPTEPEGNYEILGNALGVNGFTNWQSYVAGLLPTNAQSKFIASISIANGTPTITWTPNLAERIYTVQGKTNLTTSSWGTTNSASRFFKVNVDLQ